MEFDNEKAVVEEADRIDRLAQLTLAGDEAFPDIRAAFENEPRLHRPEGWPS